jgi:hypothetical protein
LAQLAQGKAERKKKEKISWISRACETAFFRLPNAFLVSYVHLFPIFGIKTPSPRLSAEGWQQVVAKQRRLNADLKLRKLAFYPSYTTRAG